MRPAEALRAAAFLALGVGAAGCTLGDAARIDRSIAAKAEALRDVRPAAEGRGAVTPAPEPFFGGRVVRSGHGEPLPPRLAALRLTLRRAAPMSLGEIADALGQSADGLFIRLDAGPVVAAAAMAGGVPDSVSGPILAHANAAAGLPAPASMNSSGAATLLPGDDGDFAPDFRDLPLETLLDAVCARFDCAWSYAGGTVTIARLETRIFAVKADPSVKTITSQVSGATPSPAQAGSAGASGPGGAAGGSGAGAEGRDSSSQQTSTKIDLDVWKEIDGTLAALVPAPGRYVTQRAAGVVTVVAPPSTMRRVASYFAALNRSLAARIAVEVTAIYINADRSDDVGMSLNALYKDAKTGLTYGLADIVPAFAGTPGTGSFAISNPGGAWNGTTAVIKALAANDRLADVQTGAIVTQNGVPSSLKLVTNTDIVRSVQFSTVAQAGAATTAAQASTVPTGFSLQILPRIVGASDISLIASVENSAIASENRQSVGEGASLDLLTTTERNFSINVVLGSGEQVASLGYDQYTASRTDSGLGWFADWIDGEHRAELVRTRLLLILRAVILRPPAAAAPVGQSATAGLFEGPAE